MSRNLTTQWNNRLSWMLNSSIYLTQLNLKISKYRVRKVGVGVGLFSPICNVWFRTKLPSIKVADQIAELGKYVALTGRNRRNSEKMQRRTREETGRYCCRRDVGGIRMWKSTLKPVMCEYLHSHWEPIKFRNPNASYKPCWMLFSVVRVTVEHVSNLCRWSVTKVHILTLWVEYFANAKVHMHSERDTWRLR